MFYNTLIINAILGGVSFGLLKTIKTICFSSKKQVAL